MIGDEQKENVRGLELLRRRRRLSFITIDVSLYLEWCWDHDTQVDLTLLINDGLSDQSYIEHGQTYHGESEALQLEIGSSEDWVDLSSMVEISNNISWRLIFRKFIWLTMRLTCVALSTELIIRTVEWNNVGEKREEEGGEDAGGHQVEIFLSHKLKRNLMEQTGGNTHHTNQQSLKSCHRNWSISCFTVLFLPFILKPSTFLPMQTNSQNLRKLMKPSTTARASLST